MRNWKISHKSHKIIIENYFFMTLVPIMNTLFGVLIYPYVIRKLGAESFGTYVFMLAISNYFVSFVTFGLNTPALKKTAEDKSNIELISKNFNAVFSSRLYLVSISISIAILLSIYVPIIRANSSIFYVCIAQTIIQIIYPDWLFQALQMMRLSSVVQLVFRLGSIPFIIIFVNEPADNLYYALISVASTVLSSILLFVIIKRRAGIKIKIIGLSKTREYIREAAPFFLTSVAGILKQESVTLFIGSFFGMRDVALYDLANKIINIPRTMTNQINGAIFPKIMENVNNSSIKKVLKIESWIGIAITSLVILFGYWVVLFLGGVAMKDAYFYLLALSFSIYLWLVIGGYLQFVFIAKGRFNNVAVNQFIALISFLAIAGIGSIFIKSPLFIVVALTLSGFAELFYCKYITRRDHLL